jgi:signal transduction histidine kinase
MVAQVQLGFARSAADVRAYFVDPDPRLRSLFDAATERERQLFDSLQALADEPSVKGEVATLRDRATRWHAEQRRALTGEVSSAEYARRHPLGRFMTDELLGPAATIAAALDARAAVHHDNVVRTERLGQVAILVLTLFAGGSATIVARAAQHFRVRAREEHALREAALMLTEAARLEPVLERIAVAASRVNHARSAFVERVVNDGHEVEVVAATGELVPPRGMRVPHNGSLTQVALASGSPAVIADLSRLDSPMAKEIVARCGPCSALVNLLRSDDAVHGALVLVRRPGRRVFTPADIAQPTIFAVFASLALRTAVMLDDAERRHRELQQVIESRERLIRGFSHDVKNPLGAAEGFAQLIEQGVIDDPAGRADGIRRIRAAIGTALALIDEILELARAEAGQLAIHWRPVPLLELAQDAVGNFQAVAAASGHRLVGEFPPDLPTTTTDPERVRQILANLITNAIKHTPMGGTVRVGAASRRGRREEDPTEWVNIYVADSGPGIAADQQKLLFREFSRLAPDRTRGAGLGLAISQSIAGLLGGDITVDNDPAGGARFTLWLPRRNGIVRA